MVTDRRIDGYFDCYRDFTFLIWGPVNTCVFQEPTEKAKATEDHVKRRVTNVLAKHSELFKFKSKVSEILHKARGIGNRKDKAMDESDEKRNDSIENSMFKNLDDATEKESGKQRMSEEVCEQADVEESGARERTEDNSINNGSGQSKQRRLSYSDLSIHEEFDLSTEDTEAMNNSPSNCHSAKKYNTPGDKEDISVHRYGNHLISDEVDIFYNQQEISEEESFKNQRRDEISEKFTTKSFRCSTISREAQSSNITKIRKQTESGKSFVPRDALCSLKRLFRKHVVVKKCVYPRHIFDASKIAVGMFSFPQLISLYVHLFSD